jgi:hypothetical protein
MHCLHCYFSISFNLDETSSTKSDQYEDEFIRWENLISSGTCNQVWNYLQIFFNPLRNEFEIITM